MSLTSHLKNPESPIRNFLYDRFPDTRPVLADARAKLAGSKTIRPLKDVSWGTVGTALDYRIRYYFAVTPPWNFVAWQGAALCADPSLLEANGEESGPPLVSPALAERFFAHLSETIAKTKPVGRRLRRDQEEILARYCYVLALFEQVYRAGPGIESPLYVPSPKKTVPGLLRIPRAHAVEDLRVLSFAFYRRFKDLFSCRAVLNPVFDGSAEIGGADADLILDRCLVDIKTTVNTRVETIWLYQLLGYTLLDYRDRYRIREVAIYLARQQVMLRWGLNDLVRMLSGGEAPPIKKLRGNFERVINKASPGDWAQ